jgi:hypothetical protein
MRYTVRWKPSLKQRLAEICLNASDRQAVTSVADQIDKVLRLDPAVQVKRVPARLES